jgi:hypothetical protein
VNVAFRVVPVWRVGDTLGIENDTLGTTVSAVKVIVLTELTEPALLVVVTCRLALPADPLHVRFLAAGLPATVPDEYVQPVGALSVPNVLLAIPDPVSVPVEVRVIVPAAPGRKKIVSPTR